ncbi:MAG: hypothetical protein ABSD44_17075 [Terracidiphilus sp.]
MAIIDALVICDSVMPGYARIFIDRFSSVCGKEKYVPHYEQLMQMIAELHVVTQLARFDWPGGAKFLMEPTAAGSEKNPEITIEHQQATYGIEVKAPSLQKHIKSRNENGTQIPGRMPLEMMEHLTSGDTIVTLPRDNPVKDFLISANSKFEHFKQGDTHFFGVLVIVWDDFIYEPITSLISQSSGLFTSASFYKDENDVAVPFKSVDGVFIIRMLHQFYCESKDQPLIDGRSDIMDYGEEGQFPFKVFIQNPNGTMVPTSLQLSLQGLPYAKEMGAEYTSKDLVWWIP